MPETCMVVENRRHAVTDTGDHGVSRAVSNLFWRKFPVDGPPLAIQDVQEPFRMIALNT